MPAYATDPVTPPVRRYRGGGRGPDPIDVHVGSRLKQLRTIKGISQEKVAAAIGVTFQQIQKYESGYNRISASRLVHLARTLDTPVAAFFEDLENIGDGSEALSNEDLKLLASLRRLQRHQDTHGIKKTVLKVLYAVLSGTGAAGEDPLDVHPALGYVSPVPGRPNYLTKDQLNRLVEHATAVGMPEPAWGDCVLKPWTQLGDGSWARVGLKYAIHVTPAGLHRYTLADWQARRG